VAALTTVAGFTWNMSAGSVGICADTYLQGSQHSGDAFFLLINEEHIFQNDGSTFLAGMQN
jgi:hypothetical protein